MTVSRGGITIFDRGGLGHWVMTQQLVHTRLNSIRLPLFRLWYIKKKKRAHLTLRSLTKQIANHILGEWGRSDMRGPSGGDDPDSEPSKVSEPCNVCSVGTAHFIGTISNTRWRWWSTVTVSCCCAYYDIFNMQCTYHRAEKSFKCKFINNSLIRIWIFCSDLGFVVHCSCSWNRNFNWKQVKMIS